VTPRLSSLQLGKKPCVVGTIITEDYLQRWHRQPHKLPCHLVELRVDGFSRMANWVSVGEAIQEYDIPVFATIRLSKEGGHWTGLDSDRWPLLEDALGRLAGVDVEIHSELVDLVSRLAAERGKLCVLSHHDFQRTPPLETMRDLLRAAHDRGAIGKIAATVNTPTDLANLRALLAEAWPLPICLIGMGPLGRGTRLEFPVQGSCFTYGYLDVAGAPGQYSAAELTAHFAAPPPAPEPKDPSGV
jgi:3-dehydroquinate dehydratase-1